MSVDVEHALEAAARALGAADALVVCAGAGMGVDSGLPDFRGDQGFWNAYPAYGALGLSFVDLANPRWFRDDPTLAWGFYGHRRALYRRTKPHDGFSLLRTWSSTMTHGAFVFTSNVDGQFQRAGFAADRIVECHGALSHFQCIDQCGTPLFVAPEIDVDVDEATFRARHPLPTCPSCNGLARPNVLMFGDGGWDESRTRAQHQRFDSWLETLRATQARVVIFEAGAGTAISTVRTQSEWLQRDLNATLVRANPREAFGGGRGTVSLPMGALKALMAVDAARAGRRGS